MEQLIKFRIQADTLSLDEYRTLLCTVLDQSTMQEFSCMIFNRLHQKWKNQTQTGLEINAINHTISNIVSQRQRNDKEIDSEDGETDDQSPQPPIQTNINHLTDVLIQEIASYLPFQSYSNFQSCSRSILYAANTPSTLHQLDYSIYLDACINTKDECQIKSFMKRFERVQALSIDGFNEKYIQLMPAQFKNVKHLKLHFVHGFESYGINWKEIRILDCVGYVWNENAVAIIKRCNNLSSLFLNVSRDEQNQLAKTVGGISNLQCLGLHSEVDTRVTLKNICNSLESLSIRFDGYNVDGMTFHSLRELRIEWPEQTNDVMEIINRTKHLKRLGMIAEFRTDLTHTAYYKSAFRTIFELKTLEYIYIRCCVQFSEITRLIETSFHKKRHRFKLKIDVSGMSTSEEAEELHEATVRLFNVLSNWCTHFMLILQIQSPKTRKHVVVGALDQWLDDISNTFSVCKCIEEQKRVIISNKCSVFNGYEERLIAPYLWWG